MGTCVFYDAASGQITSQLWNLHTGVLQDIALPGAATVHTSNSTRLPAVHGGGSAGVLTGGADGKIFMLDPRTPNNSANFVAVEKSIVGGRDVGNVVVENGPALWVSLCFLIVWGIGLHTWVCGGLFAMGWFAVYCKDCICLVQRAVDVSGKVRCVVVIDNMLLRREFGRHDFRVRTSSCSHPSSCHF